MAAEFPFPAFVTLPRSQLEMNPTPKTASRGKIIFHMTKELTLASAWAKLAGSIKSEAKRKAVIQNGKKTRFSAKNQPQKKSQKTA